MEQWTRAMPHPKELIQYGKLIGIYSKRVPSLCLRAAEQEEGLLALHEAGIINLGQLKTITAKELAGAMRGGFAKYRDIAEDPDRRKAVLNHCS